MANNPGITIYDFENICRTCLSREDLNPMYEKCSGLTCPAEILMGCTFVQFKEDDGLPVKICTNCIDEANKAFSFAKRCKTTDTILRNCVKIKIELTSNLSPSEKVESEEEIILPDIQPREKTPLEHVNEIKVEYVEIKPKEEAKVEYKEFKQEEELIIKTEYDENSSNSENESYKDDLEKQDKPYSEKSSNLHSKARLRFTKKENSRDKDGSPAEFDLLTDLRKKKTKGVQPNACYVCGKEFSQLGNLKNYESSQTGENPYICSICIKTFVNSRNVKPPIRIPTVKKTYKCDVCNKTFTQHIGLKRHMSFHTGLKSYTCGVCNKSFSHSGNFKIHERRHTGERPHICEICNKAFVQSHVLKNHMRTHTGEKPHICEVCKRPFAQRSALKVHMRRHTKGKLLTCGVCSTALRPDRFEHHMKIHSGETSVEVATSVST